MCGKVLDKVSKNEKYPNVRILYFSVYNISLFLLPQICCTFLSPLTLPRHPVDQQHFVNAFRILKKCGFNDKCSETTLIFLLWEN